MADASPPHDELTADVHDGGLRVGWLDAPPEYDESTVLVIAEALLPVFVVPAAVRQAVEQKLSTVERFLIEAAAGLGDLTAEDVDELIGLPAEATHRIAGHLSASGILEPVGDGYRAHLEAAREALEREAVVELHDKHLSFLVLPTSGDVLAYEHRPRRPKPPMVEKLEPVGRVPVPTELRGRTWAEVLGEKVRDQQVAGLPEGVVDVVASRLERPLPDTCPAYRCHGVLRWRDDQLSARMRLYGDRGDRYERVELSAAAGLVGAWRQQADVLHEPEMAPVVGRAVGLGAQADTIDLERNGPMEWRIGLDGAGAATVADAGHRLSRPGGLEVVDADGTTKTELAARFTPADPAAARVFAVEAAVEEIIERADPSPGSTSPTLVEDAMTAACLASDVQPDALATADVLRRLWRRRQDLVYRLRAGEDFAYA